MTSPFFSIAELTHSNKAVARGISNTPTPDARARLERLIAALTQLRLDVGRPIRVSSGYRNPVVNRLVGGVANSRHLVGDAADIRLDGQDVKALIRAAIKARFRGIGLGTTPAGVANFLHVDLRERPTVWLYNGGRVGQWRQLLGADPTGWVRAQMPRA